MQGISKAQEHIQKAKDRRAWFIGLVRKQEELAQKDPAAYRRKVRLLGLLGYSYIFGMLALSLAFIAGCIWFMLAVKQGGSIEVRLIIVAALVAVAILRSLWVKIEAPKALTLTRDEAPVLYREVDAIADRLKAPRPDEIRINEELNAAAVQVPRLGMFGVYQNILLLGMPLLLSLTPDEARGVIAHEFGHFSGAHGKFGAWAYRINRTWEQLRENLQRQGRGAWMFGGFFNWFQPRFAATTFVLRRTNEYDADRAAASVVGADNAARALMKLPFLSDHIGENFWQPFYELAKNNPAPPSDAFLGLPAAARSSTDRDTVARHLATSLKEKTDYDDTHPSLTDRLKSLDKLPEGDLEPLIEDLARPIEQSAADWFFGDRLPQLLKRIEGEYLSEIKENWGKAFARFEQYRTRLAEIEDAAGKMPLTEDEEFERVFLTYKLDGDDAAEALVRPALERHPDNAVGELILGQILVDRDDQAGLDHLERAKSLDPDYAEAALQSAARFHHRKGDMDSLDALREEAAEHQIHAQLAHQEATQVSATDTFAPHGLSAAVLEPIRASLANVPNLERAYVVNRMLPVTGQPRLYVIVFPMKKFVESGREQHELLQATIKGVSLPQGAMVYATKDRKVWSKVLDRVPGAMVFDRKG